MDVTQTKFSKHWKFQATDGLADMLQRSAARIAILRRIRRRADPYRVQNYQNHFHD